MPWCLICRAEYAGQEGQACPKCGTGGEAPNPLPPRSTSTSPKPIAPPSDPQNPPNPSPPPPQSSQPTPVRPAHLAILDAASQSAAPREESDRPVPKKRLVSSAGPSVPIRKQANDSVPNSWMSRLEAARVSTNPTPAETAPPPSSGTASSTSDPPRNPAAPPPLRTKDRGTPNGSNGSSPPRDRKDQTPVGKPAHLLIAQLEAEDRTRTSREAERVAALFAEDRSDEIAKVEIKLQEGPKKKKIPDWVVATVLVVLVIAVAGTAIYLARKEPGPTAEVDPAVIAAAEKRKQAVIALEEGHQLVGLGKDKADDAIRMYTKALELDPALASAERGMAISFALKDDDASAVEHYKKYLVLSPNASDANEVREIIDKYEKSKAAPAPQPAETKDTKAAPAKKKKRGR